MRRLHALAILPLVLLFAFGGRASAEDAEDEALPAMPRYFFLADPHVAAGEPSRGEKVSERPRPELDPSGARVRSFFVYPKVGLEERFDDNIYATKSGKKSDLITELTPSISATSNWNRHALRLVAQGKIGRYLEHSSEKYDDFTILADGRLDITRNTNLAATTSFQKMHEPRSSPDEAGAKEPLEFQAISAMAQLNQLVGRLAFVAQGTFQRLHYEDAQGLTPAGNAFTIRNRFRDRNIFEGLLGVTYQLNLNYRPFMRFTVNRRDYDLDRDQFGLKRSSYGYDAVAGLDIDFGGFVFAELFGGYQSQHYKDKAIGRPGGLDYGAQVLWNVTGLTSITTSARRSIQDTFTGTSASAFLDRVGASVDHELFRNLLLSFNTEYLHISYQRSRRTDNYIGLTLGATYMMNRHLDLNVSYAHRERISNVSRANFDENLARIRITGQF